jgi:oligopeptide transport system substrate-binding protein
MNSDSLSACSRPARRLLLLLCCLTLAGCERTSRVAAGNETGILHVALRAEPQTLDPHVASGVQEFMLIAALFEPLVRIDPATQDFEAAAAASWRFDDDGMGAEFILRSDGRWSNGDPVRAQDFVFAWRRALNPKLGNQLAEVLFLLRHGEALYSAELDDPTALGVSAIDDRTLRVDFAHPTPPELALLSLSHETTVPLHEGLLRALGAANVRYAGWTKPGRLVGNGPYMLQDWRFQRDVRLAPNPHYRAAEKLALQGLVFYPVENLNTQEKLFRTGQLHITSGIPASKIPAYRDSPGSPLVEQPIVRTQYLAVNLHRPPLDNADVRRALTQAIDRAALAGPVFHDSVTPSHHYIPVGLRGYESPDPVVFDPESARAHLARAGYPEGSGFPEIELLLASGGEGRSLATALQQMWRDELNIRVRVTVQEYQVYLSSLIGGDFELVYAGWNGGALPSGFLDRWVTGGGTNDSGFSHADYDRLVLEGARSTSDARRLMAIYSQAEALLLAELPIIPMFQAHATYLQQPSVRGVPASILELMYFKEASLAPVAAWQP